MPVRRFARRALQARLAQLLDALEIDRDQLRHALLAHGDAEQPVDPRHGQAVMGDDQEAGLGALGDLGDQAAEAVDIGVVQGRVDLVQHADRRRVGEEDGKEQRQRGQRLLAAREQRQRLQFLAGRARHDLEPGLERILLVALVERQMRAPAAEQPHEQLAEMLVDLGEGGQQPLAAFAVQGGDALAQPRDRAGQVLALALEAGELLLDLVRLRSRRPD